MFTIEDTDAKKIKKGDVTLTDTCIVASLIERLANTPGRNDKIEILKEYTQNDTVKDAVYYALNPYFQYHIRKIPKYTPNENGINNIESFIEELPRFSDRKVTGHEAIRTLTGLLEGLTPAAATVAEKIIKKDLRCGVQASTINKVFADLVPTYPCLLGKGYDEKTIKKIIFPAYSQLKADGMRVNIIYRQSSDNAGTVTIRGRSGKLVDLRGYLDHDFISLGQYSGRDNVFDGELVVLELDGSVMPRKKGNGILNKAVKGTISDEEASRVRVRLWDMIEYDKFITYYDGTPYTTRWNDLKDLVAKVPSQLYSMIECKEVATLAEALEHFEWAIIMGEEGTMLKNMAHPWEDKRSGNLVKMKSEKECELRIVAIQEGTGKYTGMMGAIVCESEDGLLKVSIGSGFTDEERKTIDNSWVRAIISARYNERIVSKDTGIYSLFLPRFLERRYDKQCADWLQEIK